MMKDKKNLRDENSHGGSDVEKNASGLLGFIKNNLNEISLLLGIFIVGAIFAAKTDTFLTTPNLINVLRSAAFLGIVTWGMTFIIIAGEIDVSVGPEVAFSAHRLVDNQERNPVGDFTDPGLCNYNASILHGWIYTSSL